ncbi:MAG: polyketide synthase dehydratase domain-containing protein [Proteobacteria bacterium]|nr:acyltransferase domain-containing protein [Desulfobulbaceae bacterium]MBU4151440.1 polyketide synthase dehydratase domain-containing protein [Pseudomonadota bacterium]
MSRPDLTRTSADIAIVGMACFFPKAPSLQAFWHNIVAGVDAIGEAPSTNLLHQVYDPDSTANDRVYSRMGGFLDHLPPFRPSEFGVMPRAIDGAEPEHFMALQVAYAAMVDAGFPTLPINREKTEVILGRGTYVNRGFMSAMQHSVVIDQTIALLRQLHPEYTDTDLALLKEKLKIQLPPFSPETAPGLCHNLVAGLIANRLDLHGRNLVMDAACASCLLALEIATDDLTLHKCDAAIVGGVQISTHAPIHMIFSHLGALSRQPHLKPFDQNADGTMLGEGIGMIVVKRLSDAIRDQHRIYAVIKGVGSSSDGRGSGLLAPRLDGEVLALRRAYDAAGIDPKTIELIEAHGTGIPLGDATEIKALRTVFGSRDEMSSRCAIGTVKSMIGHLIPAAGIAGIIKTALALHHKVLPPTLYCDTPNPDLHLEETPFYINTETRPWIHGHEGYPRRSGVNAFGFGGINSHVVLEEHHENNQIEQGLDSEWEAELFVFSGSTRDTLIRTIQNFSTWLDSPQALASSLADMSFTVNSKLEKDGPRLAMIVNNRSDLEKKLRHVLKILADPARKQIKDRSGLFFFEDQLAPNGKVAFLFPGEGSQYVNMLADLCRYFPEARSCFDLLDRAYAGLQNGLLPSSFIFPPPGEHHEAEKTIFTMAGAADAVSTANRALFRILTDLSIRPDAVVGHSTGELAALEAAGAVTLAGGEEDVLSYIRIGNSIIESLQAADDIPHGKLLAVGGINAEQVDKVIGDSHDFLCLAMANCPHQFVLCGTDETITKAETSLRRLGAICQVLPFQRAYHTKRFQAALQRLRRLYEAAPFQRPEIPLYSCLTADRYPDQPEEIRHLALEQWVKPVRFHQTINTMYADGVRIFLEIGPRANLTGFVNDILKDQPHCAVATNAHHRSGIKQLLHALGMAAAHGVPMELSKLYSHRQAIKIDFTLQTLPDTAPGGIVLNRDLPLLQLDGVDLSFLTKQTPMESTAVKDMPSPPQVSATHPTNPVMDQYFQTMERFLDIQRQTMEGFLGSSSGEHERVVKTPATPPVSSSVATRPADPTPTPTHQQNPPAAPSSPLPVAPSPTIKAKTLLLRLVSERTGYPEEMLALDQDLEAELGIDSIKRVEILGALGKELEGFDDNRSEQLNRLRTLGEIISFLEQPLQSEVNRHTLIDHVAKVVDKTEVELESVLDLDRDIFLQDHTLGGAVSRDDKSLHGLAVMPFTMSLELLAAAAAELFPGKNLSGFRSVKSLNWIIFKKRQLQITVLAQKTKESNQGLARLFIGPRHAGQAAMEGTVLFSDALSRGISEEDDQADPSWTADGIPDQLYPLALFHGLAFQNIGKVRRWGKGGAAATLTIQHHVPLFRDKSSDLLSSPLHLDAAGQVVGLWAAHFIPNQYVIFPVAAEEIDFYAAANSNDTTCLTKSATEGDAIRSDIILSDEDGSLKCRIKGLRHKRINMPEYLHHFRGSRDVMLSRPWPLPHNQPIDNSCLACSILSAGQLDFTGADGDVLREVIAHIILSRQERKLWYGLSYPETRRTEWLLARLACKEAIRRLLCQQGCKDVWPADIIIVADEKGQPQANGPWIEKLRWTPRISLSHSQGNVVALAARLSDSGGIGIDIEPFRVVDTEFTKIAFKPKEMTLLAGLPEEATEWRLRLWCSREAAIKALGGLTDQTLTITEINRQNGSVCALVSVNGSEQGRMLTITSFQQDGLICAVCIDSD